MKNIRYMMKRQFCRLVFPLSVTAAAMAQGVTVTPKATDEALINPGMGFMCYHMAGRMWAYGAPVPPGDTLDWFPGTSTVYFRLLWSELEPEEGLEYVNAYYLCEASVDLNDKLNMTGNQEIRLGRSYYLKSVDIEFSGTIISMEKLEG